VKGRLENIARRYAQALFEIVRDSGLSFDDTRLVLHDYVTLLQHAELTEILDHPAIPIERKKTILSRIFTSARGGESVKRLVTLLLNRRRLSLLPQIERGFVILWNAHRGVEAAEVLTALPLSTRQEQALREALERSSGLSVEMSVQVTPEILGGVLVRMGGRVLDGTVTSRLSALRQHMLKGAS
jgi:F-type H+-transporting ATPase subunit delta